MKNHAHVNIACFVALHICILRDDLCACHVNECQIQGQSVVSMQMSNQYQFTTGLAHFFSSLQVPRSAGDCSLSVIHCMRLRLCSVPLLTALARRTCSSRMTCWRCTWWCECDSLCIPMATRCTGKCNIAMESLSFSCLHYTKHVCPP